LAQIKTCLSIEFSLGRCLQRHSHSFYEELGCSRPSSTSDCHYQGTCYYIYKQLANTTLQVKAQCPWIDNYSGHWPVEAIAKQFFANKKSHANDKSSGKFTARQARNGHGKQRVDDNDDGDDDMEESAEADDDDPNPDTGDTDGSDAALPEATINEDDNQEEEPLPTPIRSKKRTVVVGESCLPSNSHVSATLVSSLTCPYSRIGVRN
jgi:hypothetical protein